MPYRKHNLRVFNEFLRILGKWIFKFYYCILLSWSNYYVSNVHVYHYEIYSLGRRELFKIDLCKQLDQVYSFFPPKSNLSFSRTYHYTSTIATLIPKQLIQDCDNGKFFMLISVNSHVSANRIFREVVCLTTNVFF